MRWTIVAGYEGSASSEDALALAQNVLDAAGDRLVVGCVYEYQPLGGRFASGDRAAAMARRGCWAVGDGRAESVVVPGASPAEGLSSLAAATHADLVVGLARRALRGRLLRGSTADGTLPAGATLQTAAPVRAVTADSGKILDLVIASSYGRFHLPGFGRRQGGRWIRACRCPVLVLPESQTVAGDGASAADVEEAI